jgi:hypothetical protein
MVMYWQCCNLFFIRLQSLSSIFIFFLFIFCGSIKVERMVPQHPGRGLCVQRILAARQTPGSWVNQWVFYRARNTTHTEYCRVLARVMGPWRLHRTARTPGVSAPPTLQRAWRKPCRCIDCITLPCSVLTFNLNATLQRFVILYSPLTYGNSRLEQLISR